MTIVLIAALLYLTASVMLVRAVGSDAPRPGRGWVWAAVPATLLHAGYHVQVALQNAGGPDMHFFAALSLVGLGMAGLTSLVGARGRMAALGVVVFPLAALLLAAYHGYGHEPSRELGWRLASHAWLALLSYATLSIAALLAIMLWLQERALRRREFRPWLRALPPLADLESLLFRVITVGFALLTLTLVTGVLFVDDLLAQKLVHKTVLSVLSWLVFGVLLIGRRRYGWRGLKAVHWTLSAMLLLLLAFFGSQFVIELVFGHTTR
ncbi:cytochrome c biogenesis protein CcsA [Stenotrophomonas sp. 169]|uniref:cytochrome C assembly family protein n=1 Tax=unclassified Stenotrophomonas TaxID=196198 RepID=UPI0016626DB9|nr:MULTISPECIES: cytochrome c biogenesis protein CcsA [unclassified Stenotrophomonas]MBD8636697.1 cytochrome c biogenesis protein CcsA [Stenotrophomonas sp. CFBP 13725]QNR98373.1 cytochrome c biogenesis protein CcsA [Stenotrophomonas sp. 169]